MLKWRLEVGTCNTLEDLSSEYTTSFFSWETEMCKMDVFYGTSVR